MMGKEIMNIVIKDTDVPRFDNTIFKTKVDLLDKNKFFDTMFSIAEMYNGTENFAIITIINTCNNIYTLILKKKINLMNKLEFFDTMFSIAEMYGFIYPIEIIE